MADFDSAWKEALDVVFEPFMAFFFPAAHREIDETRPSEMLEKELQKITPESEHGRRVADKLGVLRQIMASIKHADTPEEARQGWAKH